jgi:hypothetical protein
MDMGKCTSCILYINQNPTTYKETTISQRNSTLIAAFLLQSSTTNQSIPNNIIYSPPPFPKKKKKKWFCQNNSIFVETYILFYFYLKLPLNRPLDTKWIGRA